MLNTAHIKQQLPEMGELVQDMAKLLKDGTDDAPLAFLKPVRICNCRSRS
ncbi:hypothetical protein C4J86_0818 [Pseudomonas sp. R2-7-07]|nr:hypothetical protein C4J94_0813 [Pseudomonas sp. R5-89-07]AZF46071.1 hypothetical protein C4J86_0818 [Pseudomonas sp. R2-7-07]